MIASMTAGARAGPIASMTLSGTANDLEQLPGAIVSGPLAS
jgi:hypothetical protein